MAAAASALASAEQREHLAVTHDLGVDNVGRQHVEDANATGTTYEWCGFVVSNQSPRRKSDSAPGLQHEMLRALAAHFLDSEPGLSAPRCDGLRRDAVILGRAAIPRPIGCEFANH